MNAIQPTSSCSLARDNKIKSVSGRLITYCNQSERLQPILNPYNPHQNKNFWNALARVARCVLRFFVGMTLGVVGGAVGALWHAGAAPYHGLAGDGKRGIKHLQSAGADFLRTLSGGIFAGIGFALHPDSYFEKGAARSDGTIPRGLQERDAPFANELKMMSALRMSVWLIGLVILL